MARARVPTVIDPTDAFEGLTGELSDEEAEKLAAGDIALFSDPIFEGYHWTISRKRTREDIASDPEGGVWEIITKKVGPIDPVALVPEIGGGTFEFRGYYDHGDGRGRRLTRREIRVMVGPRKNFSSAPVPTAATTTANGVLTRGERLLLRMLKVMEQRIGQVAQAQAAPSQTSIKEIIEGVVAIDTLRQRGQPSPQANPDREVVGTYVEILKQGIELGREREPAAAGEGGTDMMGVIEKALPLLGRVLDRVEANRPMRRVVTPPAGARPGPVEVPIPPASGSHAEVVDPEESSAAARQMTVVDIISRNIADQVPADESADTVAEILTTDELEGMLQHANGIVIADLANRAGGRYPIFRDPAGQAYLAAVLDQLRLPDGEEVPPPA